MPERIVDEFAPKFDVLMLKFFEECNDIVIYACNKTAAIFHETLIKLLYFRMRNFNLEHNTHYVFDRRILGQPLGIIWKDSIINPLHHSKCNFVMKVKRIWSGHHILIICRYHESAEAATIDINISHCDAFITASLATARWLRLLFFLHSR